MLRKRIVDDFKMARAIKRTMKVMEEEGLNIAESEKFPEYLKCALRENSEWNEKGKPFTVNKG